MHVCIVDQTGGMYMYSYAWYGSSSTVVEEEENKNISKSRKEAAVFLSESPAFLDFLPFHILPLPQSSDWHAMHMRPYRQ